ncbi:peroxisomal biogenesis factor 1 [Heterostelium album PN500]|uniref:Peroxisomal ATPase PEX1 n=1 Tax=Heterostelium pallidum (strain ATCC 26659 / Pp 5 / PN500) TaxID=670386 RepID=D3B6L3_HETP5|nr:peroxisomal biogenesis factor 1 [Heterostelium album PN500]EFA82983.1 peroxisomal biogenesis factor 1 [Heterostelium album PN500]|eukprot:XP_020435100.1 peroxisomal biogenesis factor 1 [Heterostelium album PN500]
MELYVTFKHSTNCFVCLPPKIVHSLFLLAEKNAISVNSLTLELSWYDKSTKKERKINVGWSGGASDPSSGPDAIEMNAELGDAIGIADHTRVTVKAQIGSVPQATSVQVEPLTSDDWEILELHQEYLEQQILNQVNVMTRGQIVPIWIHHSTIIKLKIVDTAPSEIVRLTNQVEIAVAPKPRNLPAPAATATHNAESLKPRTLLVQDLSVDPTTSQTTIYISSQSLQQFHWNEGDIVQITIDNCNNNNNNNSSDKNNKNSNNKSNSRRYSLFNDDNDNIDENDHHNNKTNNNGDGAQKIKIGGARSIYARVYISSQTRSNQHILIGRNQRLTSSIFINSKVRVKLIPPHSLPICPIHSMTLHQVIYQSNHIPFAAKTPKSMVLPSHVLKEIVREWSAKFLSSTRYPLVNGSILSIPPSTKHNTPTIDLFIQFNQQQQNQQQQQQQQSKDKKADFASYLNSTINNRIGGVLDDNNISAAVASSHQNNINNNNNNSQQQQQQQHSNNIDNNSNKYQMNYGLYMVGADSFMTDINIGRLEKLLKLDDFYEIGDIFYRVGGIQQKIKESLEYMTLLLRSDYSLVRTRLGTPGFGGIIITGPHGSGKTLLATALSSYLASNSNSLAYVVKLNCSELKEVKVEKIRKILAKTFEKVENSRPSILLFEDLDAILPNPNEQDPGSKIRCDQIGSFLKKLAIADSSNQQHPIVMVATAQSTQVLYKEIQTPDLFGMTIEIPPPTREERIDILKIHLKLHQLELDPNDPESNQKHLLKFSSTLEGYLPIDVEALVERSIHIASIHSLNDYSNSIDPNNSNSNNSSSLTCSLKYIKLAYIKEAKEGYTPITLKGVKLHESDAAQWNDIGGLANVRAMVKETVGWPSKYPRLFQSSPIRMRSGLLLYGPPGCGKTMLASSIAGEFGLNFISVKGPELLNKYIGSSEQAVRDMFTRASSATPCVLFFDEFDSIAPRRGHDSTGVTDRVVNQFLTELDGVEGLRGVYVLAATSRPDLIDPALLRPGRLDKSLYCNIPEQHERLEILEKLAAKMNIDLQEVSLVSLAEKTEHYTGTDLRALMYNSQLKAIHEFMKEREERKKKEREEQASKESNNVDGSNIVIFQPNNKDNISAEKPMTMEERSKLLKKIDEIKQQYLQSDSNLDSNDKNKQNQDDKPPLIKLAHFDAALADSSPSVPLSERKRYEKIKRFGHRSKERRTETNTCIT